MRSSGSAAAMAVSHGGGQLVLALGLGGCRRRRTRGARGPGRPASSVDGIGTATEGALEHQARGSLLSQVEADARLHDAKLEGLVRVGAVGERLGDEPEGHVGAPEGPLAVGEHGPVGLVAAHAAVRAELTGGLGVVTRVIGGDADGLAHRGDAGRPVAGGAGVGERRLGVVVDEASRGDEVGGDLICVARVEALERTADRRVELPGVDPLGDLRAGRQRRTIGPRGRPPAGTWRRRLLPAATDAARRTGALRPVTLRLAVLPLRAIARWGGHPADGGRPTARGGSVGRPGACGPATADDRRSGRSPRGAPGRAGGHPADDGPASRHAGAAERWGRSPCGLRSCHCGRSPVGRSPCGRRSCQLAGRPNAGAGRPAACGPATAGGRRRAGHPADAVLPVATRGGRTLRPVALRLAVLPLRTIAGGPVTLRTAVLPLRDASRWAGRPAACGPATADDRRWAGHPADDGPASRHGGAAERWGRSPCGLRSCHCDERRPDARTGTARTLRTLALRLAVLPVAPGRGRTLRPVTVLTRGPFVTRRCSRSARREARRGHPADGDDDAPPPAGPPDRAPDPPRGAPGLPGAAGTASGPGAAAVARPVGTASR